MMLFHWWMLQAFIFWLILTRGKFAEDRKDVAFEQYFAWLISPVYFLLMGIAVYLQRDRLRWLRKYWFPISFRLTLDRLCNIQRRRKK